MKLIRLSVFVVAAAWCAAEAQAQLGLYGSPEPLPLQQTQTTQYGARPTVSPQAVPAAYNGGPQIYQTANDGPRMPSPPPPAPQGSWAPNQQAPYQQMPAPQPIPQSIPQPAPASGMSVVNEMMNNNQAGPAGYPAPDGTAGCAAPCLADGCCAPCATNWYGSLIFLYMTRDQPNMLYTSAMDSNWADQWGNNHFDWRPGGELRIGRNFCCGQWAIEGAYWTLDQFSGVATPPYDANGYDTPFQMNVPNQFDPSIPELTVLNTWDSAGDPTTPQEWFDASPQHRLSRVNEMQNIEINFLRNRVVGDGCQPLNIDCVLGVRWFRFRDRLTFSAQHQANDWLGQPSDFAGDWIYLDDEVTNNLLGVQFGVNTDYRVAERWKVFVNPRFGLFNNRTNLDYNLYAKDGAGNTLQGSSLTYQPLDYPIHASSNGISFMAQIDVGVEWQFTQNWGATLGYRVVGFTGMGLADNQVPSYGNDTLAIARMDRNGDLVLHGGFAGLTFNF